MASETEFKFITLQEAEPGEVETEDEVIFAGVSDSHASRTGEKVHQVSSQKSVYQETTLEDLKDLKMPFAQKAVIVSAIILIIVAIVYYLMVLK